MTEKEKFGESRIDYRSSGEIVGKALEDFYQFEVVMDITVSRNNIQHVVLQFDAAILFAGTHLEGQYNGMIEVIIDEDILNYIFFAPLV